MRSPRASAIPKSSRDQTFQVAKIKDNRDHANFQSNVVSVLLQLTCMDKEGSAKRRFGENNHALLENLLAADRIRATLDRQRPISCKDLHSP
jgi:hypothetical protein